MPMGLAEGQASGSRRRSGVKSSRSAGAGSGWKGG